MKFLDIKEKKSYSLEDCFAEEFLFNLFEKYFNKLYQENTVKWLMMEMKKDIVMNIPKRSVFIEKDSILYCVNENLNFKVVPEDIFEIDEYSHSVLLKCFEKCYQEFKEAFKDRKKVQPDVWDDLLNLNLSTTGLPHIESLKETFCKMKEGFTKILQISLKQKLVSDVIDKIGELYESVILQDDPIMIITKKEQFVQKRYAVTDSLECKEIMDCYIERELEETIYTVIPEDIDFLLNRICNFIRLPLWAVQPYIRVNNVKEHGFNAIAFLEERQIPVVYDFEDKKYYAFLRVEYKSSLNSSCIKYTDDMITVSYLMKLEEIMKKIQRINNGIFDNISCYVEHPHKVYMCKSGHKGHEATGYTFLYRMENRTFKHVCEGIVKESEITALVNESSFWDIMKRESEKAQQEGCYRFCVFEFPDVKE